MRATHLLHHLVFLKLGIELLSRVDRSNELTLKLLKF